MYFVNLNFSGLLGKKIHKNTIHSFIRKNGLKGKRARFSNDDDEVLREKIRSLNQQFPRSGYREMQSLLRTAESPTLVQRERVRRMLAEVDPIGSAQRLSVAVKRRVYRVPTPNYLWHLDSNHKLIR